MEKLISHSPLLGYFALIGYLLSILKPFSIHDSKTSTTNARIKLFQFLAILALLFTWIYMILYFIHSFKEAALRAGSPTGFNTHDWLTTTSLFNEAWSRVCFEIERWWWSQQLCLWTTGTLTVLLYSKANTHGIKRPWAYMLLGQVVAISFAQSLFLAELESKDDREVDSKISVTETVEEEITPSYLLCTCVYLSLITVAISPYLFHTHYFLPNLLLMHFLLIFPLLPTSIISITPTSKGPISFTTLYLSISFINFLLLIPTYTHLFPLLLSTPIQTTFQQLYHTAIFTLFEHPAQSSIGFDVVFTTVSFLTWIFLNELSTNSTTTIIVGKNSPETSSSSRARAERWIINRILLVLSLIVLAPVVGINFVGSLYLAIGSTKEKKVEKQVEKRD